MSPLELSRLSPPAGSKKNRKRVGRGPGSGMDATSTRGHKGQKARSGGKGNVKNWSEGGQMPLQRRIPKRGFTNIFREEFQVVNIDSLKKCRPGEVTPETLRQQGIIKSTRLPVKVLGMGKLEAAYHVKAAAFSKSAIEKIQAAGGNTEVI
jgi:large subunit ribosomal protein L15